MTFRTMAERLNQADPRRDRLGYAVGVLLIGAYEQPRDHRAPSQAPVDQSAAPPPPCRPGHFPSGTALGAGPRAILRLPRDPHTMIVAARWCQSQAPLPIRRRIPYDCRGLARQSGLASGLVSITTTLGEPADAEPPAPRMRRRECARSSQSSPSLSDVIPPVPSH
jgi:hypothetical protein